MAWGLFLAISVVAQSVASIYSRVIMRDAPKHTWAYAALSQMLTGLLIGMYALWAGFDLLPIRELWPWLLAVVILNTVSNIFFYEAMRTAEASLFTIFASSRVLVSMFAAIIVLGEVLTISRVAGAALIILAIVLVSSEHFRIQMQPWMYYTALYALCSGVIFIFDARIVSESDVASYMALAFFLPGVATLVIKPQIIGDMGRLVVSRQIVSMLMYSGAYGVMAVTLWLAYQHGGDASQIAPIRQVAVVLTVILAVLFLRERTHILRKSIGAVLAAIAVYLIAG